MDDRPQTSWFNFPVCLATGFWVGLIPFAPGTLGSLWGLLAAVAITQIPNIAGQATVILAICLLGIPLCSAAAQRLGKKDPGQVVWDEIASMPITFFLVSPHHMTQPIVLAAGFGLNRLFDITKPWPINRLETLPGGLGIMADDWAAGVYSCVILHLLLSFDLLSSGPW